jgi:hypothetical protein
MQVHRDISMLIELLLSCAIAAGFAADGDGEPAPKPPDVVVAPVETKGVEWTELATGSLRFLGVMHAFRLATEPGTRSGGFGVGPDYFKSLGNLHGWADGDPFYVNYVGHPMQGAVSGRLFQLHDRRYRRTEFGAGADYWKGKLRAMAFSWAFSEQFEIGPLSEASIGHIQRDFPQQGFVDHVVTPVVGFGWMIGEDAMDRYVIKSIEARTRNGFARAMARSFLNPARAFANLMDWRLPWYRNTRSGILSYTAPTGREDLGAAAVASPPPGREIAPLEFTAGAGVRQIGGEPCVGGGGEAAFRVATDWELVATVNGCKMTGQRENVSGDALVYQLGPRWTPMPGGKWSPYAHLLIGGMKVTQETLDPAEKKRVLDSNNDLDSMLSYTLHSMYTTQQESNALAVTAGMGVDYRVSPAVAIRVANLEYLYGSARLLNGSGFQMSTGMVLRWGTW